MTDVQSRQPTTPPTELPMLRAYRLWFEHTRKCTTGCKGTPKAQDGCEDGRQLWGTYRLARIGKTTTP
ncbi:hypothetical protein [Streptomyces griseiscabiei]|uniref:Uncharacterized protein n=1 Tax=Streptomyces griseiscabiei TaxID=2993540 RepID=A0ABU4KX02_9ACTN|nr:hypothetical protein [Streptomyces griseiscabiei]MBZ3900510.1 hypothetical protein [Streptomyces griseiscabiei]MDX2907825.1 hypothetical protein [Streptomyces griseiscabiei]